MSGVSFSRAKSFNYVFPPFFANKRLFLSIKAEKVFAILRYGSIIRNIMAGTGRGKKATGRTQVWSAILVKIEIFQEGLFGKLLS